MCTIINFYPCWKGHLTAKSDVYSFGVVLLEMLSGKKAIDKNRPTGEHNLVEWAKPYLTNKRRIFRILDARLEGQYSMGRALRVANLAIHCLSVDPKVRPSMDEVVTTLEQLQDLKGTSNHDQKDSQLNLHGNSGGGPRHCRRSAEEAPGMTAYPRPSASPLYAWRKEERQFHCESIDQFFAIFPSDVQFLLFGSTVVMARLKKLLLFLPCNARVLHAFGKWMFASDVARKD